MKIKITYTTGSEVRAKIIETWNQWSNLYELNNHHDISDSNILRIEKVVEVEDTTTSELDRVLDDLGLDGF